MQTAQGSLDVGLDAAWRARVVAAPRGVAVLHEDVVWSAEELDARVDAMAVGLERAGIGGGDEAVGERKKGIAAYHAAGEV